MVVGTGVDHYKCLKICETRQKGKKKKESLMGYLTLR